MAVYDLDVRRGARYDLTLRWLDAAGNPKSLAGLKARMHVRPEVESTTVLTELTDDNGRIVLQPGGEVGRIDIRLGATVTAAMSAGVYDLEVYDPLNLDNVEILLSGKVRVKENVTR